MLEGRSRENPIPPAWHGWQSCWGGMFAAKREWLCDLGAFDMAFNCRHAGEDQHLGRRIMAQENQPGAWICEPPFSWMGAPDREDWLPLKTNSCKDHDLKSVVMNAVEFMRCSKCPFQVPRDPDSIYAPRLLIRYDPSLVELREIQL